MKAKVRINFERLMSPRHIAFFGGWDAEVAIKEAKRRNFSGQIWPVNPKREKILGFKCYKSVEDLPCSPDASFIAVPAITVPKIIKDLANIEAGGVVCYSAGFSETGSDGKKLERYITKLAKNMPIIGPNCYGFINYLENVALWPFAHGGWCPGFGVAIITQSGMLSSDITMTDRSLPLTHMISVGNQCSLSIEDFIDYFCENPKVRAIGVHIEGIKDIKKFHNSAIKCARNNKALVALKTGGSQVGRNIATTHTGSMSGTDDLYQALFERTGVIRVDSPVQFIETLKFLCVSGIPRNEKIVAFTCSGGGAMLLADYAEKIDLHLPQFRKYAKERLSGLLPKIATVSNPLDYTTPIWGIPEKTFPVFLEAIKFSKASTAILLQDYPAKGLDESQKSYLDDAKAFIKAAKKNGTATAICNTFAENFGEDIRKFFISQNVTPLQGIEEALKSVKLASTFGKKSSRLRREKTKSLLNYSEKDSKKFLTEAKSKDILQEIGLNTPKRIEVSIKSLNKEKINFSYPVVLKSNCASIIHKSEINAISTNIYSFTELKSALQKMYTSLDKLFGGHSVESFLVEQMQDVPIVELLIGIQADNAFGYSLLLGSGGIQAEILDDKILVLLPTSRNELKKAIKSLKIFKLMNGFRGKESVNIDNLTAEIFKISTFFEENNSSISELEINPLFVYKDKICIVDAIIKSG